MKTRRILALSLCITMIMSSFAGCSKDAPFSEEITSSESSSAVTTSEAVKKEEIVSTTTLSTNFIEKPEDYEDNEDDEEVIWDGAFDTNLDTYNIKYCDLKIKNARFFSEGLCAYQDERTGFWGYMDTDFNVAIRPQYSNAYPFSDGLAAVYDGDKWGFIDKTGSYIIKPSYHDVFYKYTYDYMHSGNYVESAIGFMDGYALVGQGDTARYIIDMKGNIVKELKNEVNTIHCGDGMIYLFGLYSTISDQIVNSKFDAISNVKYDSISAGFGDIQFFTPKYLGISFEHDRTVYVIDKYENLILSFEDFDEKYCYSAITNDTFTLQKKSSENTYHTALYDYSFNEIIPFYYTSIFPICKNGDAKYYIGYFKNDECELLDKDGNVLDYEWFDGSSFVGAQLCEVFGENTDEFMFLFKANTVSLVNLTKNKVEFEVPLYPNMPEMPQFESSYSKNYEYTNDPIGFDLFTYVYNNYFLITDMDGEGYLYGINGELLQKIDTSYYLWANNDIVSHNLSEGILCNVYDPPGTINRDKTFMKLE